MNDDPSLRRLLGRFDGLGEAVVALSGGVDSSLVLAAAARALGAEHVLAATATSPIHRDEELAAARKLAADLGVEHVVIEMRELDDARFARNTRDRCFFCKAALFDELARLARARGDARLVDGANADDLGDHRPGMRAAAERGVLQPLLSAGIGKAEVRRLARHLGLAAWDAPEQACLASRVPYGEAITAEKLAAVAAAERALGELGFRQRRVRHHGAVARIEVECDELRRALALREEIGRAVHAVGFTYVALDMDGFRTGSMNEA